MIIFSKYGLEPGSVHSLVKLQSWWWKDLYKVCKERGGKGWFQEELSWKLGCGDKVKFWEEVWVGSSALKSLFPRLFSLSLNQGQTVGEVGVWINSDWRRRLTWRRARFEWESSLEAYLFTLLSGALMRRNDVDVQVWGKEEPGLFSVNSSYECLAKQSCGTQSDVFNFLWKTKAFPNVIVTAWRGECCWIESQQG